MSVLDGNAFEKFLRRIMLYTSNRVLEGAVPAIILNQNLFLYLYRFEFF